MQSLESIRKKLTDASATEEVSARRDDGIIQSIIANGTVLIFKSSVGRLHWQDFIKGR